jgi:hypothetical protein
MDIVCDTQVASHAYGTGDGAPMTDSSRTRDTRTGGHRRVLSDMHVVADLYEVVDLNTVLDDGIVEGASIDSRARADLDIIAEVRCAELWYPYPTFPILREAESVATDNSTRMDQDPVSKLRSVANGDLRHQLAIGTDTTVTLDDATGTDC